MDNKKMRIEQTIDRFKRKFYKKFGVTPIVRYCQLDTTDSIITLDEVLLIIIEQITQYDDFQDKLNLLRKRNTQGFLGNLKKVYCKICHDLGFSYSSIGEKLHLDRVSVLQNVRKANHFIDIGYPDICVIFETAMKEIKKINAKKEESISVSALG